MRECETETDSDVVGERDRETESLTLCDTDEEVDIEPDSDIVGLDEFVEVAENVLDTELEVVDDTLPVGDSEVVGDTERA